MFGQRMSCSVFVCHPSHCGNDLKWLSHVIGTLPGGQPQENLQRDLRGRKQGTFQIPVDSFNETSGGGRMLTSSSNLYDSSPSTTNQRPHDEVYETPRFRSPDPYLYRYARLAASRCLRENDAHRTILSDIQNLSLSTTFDGKPTVRNAV